MARDVQLHELIKRVRHETGRSTAAGGGIAERDTIIYRLQQAQEELYEAHDWTHLTVTRTKTLAAGQRYYDMPTDLNLDRISDAYVYDNDIPTPLTRGIGREQYASYDPVDNERADPALRWDLKWTGSSTQMEIWPLPASSGAVVEFRGIRSLRALVDDNDVCDLDSQLIVMTVAGQLLARQKSADAQLVLDRAKRRWDTLTANARALSEPVVMNGGMMGRAGRPHGGSRDHVIIRIASSS